MKPTDKDIQAITAAIKSVHAGAYPSYAESAWAVIAPLVLDRAAKECDRFGSAARACLTHGGQPDSTVPRLIAESDTAVGLAAAIRALKDD